MTMAWQQRYMQRFYSGRDRWMDGTTEFHRMCSAAIPAGSTVLEIGAGPSNPTSEFLRTRGRLVGLDVDVDVASNRHLDEAHVFDGHRFPFDDGSFDACVSNYVVEHVADPVEHLREVSRVLKPGGVYVFRTPNQFHYTALVSRFTPYWLHRLIANRLRGLGPDVHDPYPTVYAMNSRASVTRYAAEAGLEIEELRLVEKEPSYGMSSRALFLGFMAYERLVNATPKLQGMRANIFGVLSRPERHR
jgi:SAM-dependent methyltransferase